MRRKFHLELDARFKQSRCKVEEGVEEAWQCFRDNVKEAALKVAGRNRKMRQNKATGWWSEQMKEAVRRNKELYTRALGEKTERAWEEYKKANKEAKRVVQEAKEEELIRCGKEFQKDFLGNRRNL